MEIFIWKDPDAILVLDLRYCGVANIPSNKFCKMLYGNLQNKN